MKNIFNMALFGVLFSFFGVSGASQLKEVNQVQKKEAAFYSMNPDGKLPKEAQEWLEYIKKMNPEISCPLSYERRVCQFISQVVFLPEVNGFKLSGYSHFNGKVQLPQFKNKNNANIIWPKTVKSNSSGFMFVREGNSGFGVIDKGDFEITLTFNKDDFNNIGTVSFKDYPLIIGGGNAKVSLGRSFERDLDLVVFSKTKEVRDDAVEDVKKSSERMTLDVFRKVEGAVPSRLSTKIKISYTGAKKDFELGRVVPDGFRLSSITSTLKFEEVDNKIILKLVGGEHVFNVEAFSLVPNLDIKTESLVNGVNQEVWSLAPDILMRSVGVSPVDVSVAKVPEEWKSYPAYLVKGRINFEKLAGGINVKNEAEILTARTSWVGLNGEKIVHRDILNVNNSGNDVLVKKDNEFKLRSFRLDHTENQVGLGPQVILNNGGVIGVSVPKGAFKATVETETEGGSVPLSVFSGENTVSSWSLNLSPRTRLVAVTGDGIKSKGDWLSGWNLYVVFFIFFIVLAFYKIFGLPMAILSCLSLVVFKDSVFSFNLWITILLVMGVLKLANENSENNFLRTFRMVGYVSVLFFALLSFFYTTKEIQFLINPTIEVATNYFSGFNASFAIGFVGTFFLAYVANSIFKNGVTFKRILSVIILFIFVAPFFLFVSTKMISDVVPSRKAEILNAQRAEPQAPALSNVAPAEKAARSLSSAVVADSVERYRETVVNKKTQVGGGFPEWSGVFNYSIKAEKTVGNEVVKLWIAPIWLVNVFALFQIVFLWLSVFVFVTGMLYFSNRRDWFLKVPARIRENVLFDYLLNGKIWGIK